MSATETKNMKAVILTEYWKVEIQVGSTQFKILPQTSWVTMAKSFSSSMLNTFQARK